MTDPEILKQINRSGFPFQLAVEHEIRRTQVEHQWSVVSREHPWTNPDTGSSGFIDLVLEHNENSTLRLVIECKRNRGEDKRLLRWIFLLPDREPQSTAVASCFEVEGWGENAIFRPEGRQKTGWSEMRVWDDVRVSPISIQTEFCILHSDESRKQSILESLAREVLDSAEGLAEEEVSIERSSNEGHVRVFIFPAIVTNAEIAVCSFKSSQVNIEDGTLEFDDPDVNISILPFIRFRKSLANEFPKGSSFSNLKDANRARERTVFVVNAACLPEFLRNWKLERLSRSHGFAFERFRQQWE